MIKTKKTDFITIRVPSAINEKFEIKCMEAQISKSAILQGAIYKQLALWDQDKTPGTKTMNKELFLNNCVNDTINLQ